MQKLKRSVLANVSDLTVYNLYINFYNGVHQFLCYSAAVPPFSQKQKAIFLMMQLIMFFPANVS